MKKSLMMFAAIAMSAAAVGCAYVRHATVEMVEVCAKVWRWVVRTSAKVLRQAAEVRAWRLPAVALFSAKQYYLRQVERERPTMQARWRMAPSV